MADILAQAGARTPAAPTGLAQVPTGKERLPVSTITAPFTAIAEAEGALGTKLDDATAQWSADAGRNSVTVDENGQPQVTTLPFEFSASDKQWNAAAKAKGLAISQDAVQQHLTELRAENLNDPDAFRKAGTAYVKTLGSTGDKSIAPLTQQFGADLFTKHLDSMRIQRATLDSSNAQTALLSRAQDATNQMMVLARQGGTDTPEFKQAQGNIQDIYGQLGSNPAYGFPADKVKGDLQRLQDMATGEATTGKVDATFKAGGEAGVRDMVRDTITNNPNLHISDADRNRLAAIADNRLTFLNGERRKDIATHRQTVDAIAGAYDKGRQVDNNLVDAAITKAQSLGDSESVAKLEMKRLFMGQGAAGTGAVGLPDAARQTAIGGAGAPAVASQDPVATDLPAPARAFLNVISGGESGGKYNVRFTPQGGATFSDLSHHPDIAAMGPEGPSTAAGRYQFIKSTWDSLGGGSFDPASQDRKAWQLAQRDYASRTGRDLGADLQSGGLTPQILKTLAPTWTSFNTGADKKIATYNTSLARFGAGGGTTAPPTTTASIGSPASIPFTADQGAANPSLLPQYIKATLADQDRQVKAAGSVADGILAGLTHRDLPSEDNLGLVIQTAQKYPDAGLAEKVSSIGSQLKGYDLARQALGTTEANGAALMARAHDAAQGAPIVAQKVAEAAQDFYKKGVQAMKADPVAEGAARGWYSPVQPLDFSSSAAINQTIQDHGGSAIARGAHMGSAQAAFGPPELAQVKDKFANGTTGDKVAMLASIATLPDAVRDATLAQLGGSAETAVYAYAGGLAQVAPDIAKSIVQGRDAMQAKQGYVPSKGPDLKNYDLAKTTALPAAAFAKPLRMASDGPLVAMGQAVDARYAYLSAQAGDTSGALNSQRMTQATADITGGVLTQNGAPVIAPARGMDQRTFDGVLRGITDQDMAGVTTGNGAPISADYLRSSGKLHAVGDGQYLVQLNQTDTDPKYAARGGQLFVLDLRGRQPPANDTTPVSPFAPNSFAP